MTFIIKHMCTQDLTSVGLRESSQPHGPGGLGDIGDLAGGGVGGVVLTGASAAC